MSEEKTSTSAEATADKAKKVEETKNPTIDPTSIKSGMTVRVHQKVKEMTSKGEEKERIQVFEGLVISKKGKTFENARIIVRKIAANRIGVEKLFPIASPNVTKIEIVKTSKVRRAKLYFARNTKKKFREKKTA